MLTAPLTNSANFLLQVTHLTVVYFIRPSYNSRADVGSRALVDP